MKFSGLTDKQIQRRRLGIGGSDAKIIANGTQEDWQKLWLQKTNKEEPVFDSRSRFLMALGTATESVTLARLDEEVHLNKPQFFKTVVEFDKFHECTHDDFHFLRCNLDATVASSGQAVEVKFHTGNKTFKELAEYYAPQLQHNMMCNNSVGIVFAVTFGHYGNFKWDTLKADYDWQGHYVEKAIKFWDHVTQRTPPSEPNKPIENPNQETMQTIEMNKTSSANAWASYATDWLENKPKIQMFKECESDLKALVPKTANLAIGNGIQIKRAKNNRLSITKIEE